MALVLEKPVHFFVTLALLVTATACSSRHHAPAQAQRGMYKIGAPYTIDGITYVPTEEFQHTETGVASWYGPGFHGKYTANGEVYDQSERTAAHRTLQMPSVLRVTNLENGQSTIVRVNDRGPFARARILDVSRAAAEELGMVGNGTARVRVEQLEMESQAMKQIALNGGGADEQRSALYKYVAGRRGPPAVSATAQATPPPPPPTPAVTVYPSNPRSPTVAPMEASGGAGAAPSAGTLGNGRPTVASIASSAISPQSMSGFYVQTGAFSTMGNAEKQRSLITSYGSTEISPASSGGREVYRVRLGPYSTQEAAGMVADRLRRSGYGDARVVAD
ncbi:MAG: septal ring lytic transglycosylase RlpA family protein [Reyranella sp.]|uniref:septal ring lytic transglycosylase RlpA family protein n=1 Tax=Reyranella sp. TaxID=1929291 RepID=UPI001AC342CA|nr:septal ring lytic transglycosylase RlpA family protein [Reyranella sp.]MBN9090542.1 septal ring lytic transglycosylase RlpA family protein [Reyranella sp.]